MKKHSLASKILWISFAAMVLASMVICIVAVLNEYEKAENYFLRDSALAPLSLILGIIAAVCGIAAVCATKRADLSDHVLPKNFNFPLTSIGFVFAAGVLIISSASTLGRISVPFLLVACVYCILTGTKLKARQSLVAIVGFSTVLGSILLNAYYYFDFTVEMNAPIKVALQMGLLMMMLCYTGELRYVLGIQKPKMYLILSVLGITSTAFAGLPIIILNATAKGSRPDYVASAVLLLTFMLTQIARVIYLLRGIHTPEPTQENDIQADKPILQEETTDAFINKEEGNEQ